MNQDIVFFTAGIVGLILLVIGSVYGIYIVIKPEKDLSQLDNSDPLVFKCSNFKFTCDFKTRIVRLDVAYTSRLFDLAHLEYEVSQNTKTKTTVIPSVYTGMVNGQPVSLVGPGQAYSDTVDTGDFSLIFTGIDAKSRTPIKQEFLNLSSKATYDFGLVWTNSFLPRRSKLLKR